MRRGFKSEAERGAAGLRADAGLPDSGEPVDLTAIAARLRVGILPADQLVDVADLHALHKAQAGAWSALTFVLPGPRHVVVYNPVTLDGSTVDRAAALHRSGRTRSDVAHEIAHLVLGHDVRQLQQVGGFTLFTCDPEQEAEANWFAGCLLLPRDALLTAARAGQKEADVAEQYCVSQEMARWRLNASGARLQASRTGPRPRT